MKRFDALPFDLDDTAENVQGAMAVGIQAVHISAGHGVADAIANSVRELQPLNDRRGPTSP